MLFLQEFQTQYELVVLTEIQHRLHVFQNLFSGFDIQFVFLTAVIVSIFTVFFNLLFLRNRQEYEYFAELTSQIFIFDYLIAFLLAFYFVDAVKIVNGLF